MLGLVPSVRINVWNANGIFVHFKFYFVYYIGVEGAATPIILQPYLRRLFHTKLQLMLVSKKVLEFFGEHFASLFRASLIIPFINLLNKFFDFIKRLNLFFWLDCSIRFMPNPTPILIFPILFYKYFSLRPSAHFLVYWLKLDLGLASDSFVLGGHGYTVWINRLRLLNNNSFRLLSRWLMPLLFHLYWL